MAKLFASEICLEVSVESMRIHGGYGYTTDLTVERHFRDAPLMIIGEGTNEIQKLLIAKNVLKNYPSGDFDLNTGRILACNPKIKNELTKELEKVRPLTPNSYGGK